MKFKMYLLIQFLIFVFGWTWLNAPNPAPTPKGQPKSIVVKAKAPKALKTVYKAVR